MISVSKNNNVFIGYKSARASKKVITELRTDDNVYIGYKRVRVYVSK